MGGIGFVRQRAGVAASSASQYRQVIRQLKPVGILAGSRVNAGPAVNLVIALMGLLLVAYLVMH